MVEHNPVCWDTNKVGDRWQENGANPWVVGRAKIKFNNNARNYDCRGKCAGDTGEFLTHCATNLWWDKERAQATVCTYNGTWIDGKYYTTLTLASWGLEMLMEDDIGYWHACE